MMRRITLMVGGVVILPLIVIAPVVRELRRAYGNMYIRHRIRDEFRCWRRWWATL